MNPRTAVPCLTALSLVTILLGIPMPSQSQPAQPSGTERESAPHGSPETAKPSAPRKGDSNATGRGAPSAGRPKQLPRPPDGSQIVEERLRAGQVDKPIAQGEISDRLNQIYSESNK